MFEHVFLYPIISRAIAAILVVAAVLKGSDWLGPMFDRWQHWPTIAFAAFEFILAIWLFLGVRPRLARLVTLVCFLVFLNVAIWGIMSSQESCGCLGRRVTFRPWVAAALDTIAIAALLASAPLTGFGASTTVARWHVIALGLAAGVAALVIAYPFLPQSQNEAKSSSGAAAEPVGVDSAGLAQVIEGLERNRAALKTVAFSTEETHIEHPVAALTKYMVGTEEAKQAYLRGGDRIGRYKCEYVYRDDEIRVDRRCLQSPNGPADKAADHDMLLVGSKGRRVHYVPGPRMKQAWLTTMKTTVDEDGGDTMDLRCAGFSPPLRSIADWVRQHEVLAAGMVKGADGRAVFLVRALEKRAIPDYVTAIFEPEISYLPSRVIYWFHPRGGVLRVTDIRYAPLADRRGWFPESIRTRTFIRNTTDDPDGSSTGQNGSAVIQISKVNVDVRIADETFDPILPSGTVLMGDLAATGRLGDQPQPASASFRSEPRKVTRRADSPAAWRAGAGAWLITLALNAVALGVAFFCRKRFALSPFPPLEDGSHEPKT